VLEVPRTFTKERRAIKELHLKSCGLRGDFFGDIGVYCGFVSVVTEVLVVGYFDDRLHSYEETLC